MKATRPFKPIEFPVAPFSWPGLGRRVGIRGRPAVGAIEPVSDASQASGSSRILAGRLMRHRPGIANASAAMEPLRVDLPVMARRSSRAPIWSMTFAER